MSSGTEGSNGTVITTGPKIIQTADFFVDASILHPLVVGSIAVICLFVSLRVGSNRSVAPITIFDWLINVALGSTLAGIVNGNSLIRGLLGLFTLLSFQYVTSYLGSHYYRHFEKILSSPPLVIAFRGRMLKEVMRAHRIAPGDLNGALRQSGILNITQVECIVIEPTGNFSIFTTKQVKDADVEPCVLLDIPAYKALCTDAEKSSQESCRHNPASASGGSGANVPDCNDEQNGIAGDAC